MHFRARVHRSHVWAVLGCCGVVAFVWLLGRAADSASYETWKAIVVVPVLLLGSVPLLARAGRGEPGTWFLRLLVAAFVLKALATVARYLMAFVLYDGSADAAVYDKEGTRLAEAYRAGDVGAEIGRDFVGTGFVRVLTGIVYTITGPSIFVAFAVFSWLGFWGLYLLYRAFRIGVPDGDAKRYAVLVLLLPSMLFWPSSLGKEAWMTFGIGLFAYGVAKFLQSSPGWQLPLVLGVVATVVTRPHVTTALFAGFCVAYLLRRNAKPWTHLTPVVRGVTIAALVVAGFVLVNQAASFLDIDEVTVSNVDASIEETGASTAQGGSEYDASGVNSLADVPRAIVSVLFRPFPFEADSAQLLIASAEGTILLALACLSLRRLPSLPGRLRRQPYLLFAGTYSLLFIYAFSNFANFGMLTRERVQVLPFVLVFFALPLVRGRHSAHAVRDPLPRTRDERLRSAT